MVFVQNAWTALDGSATTREFLLMALADLDAILIRATFTRDTDEARYNFLSLKQISILKIVIIIIMLKILLTKIHVLA